MQKYNVFQAIVMSFYSADLYRDVARNWGGKAFFYLLFLLALSWIPITYEMQHALNLAYQRDSQKISSQIPVLTIKEGKLYTPENRPYLIRDPKTQELLAVIDTSGQYTQLEQTKSDMLITQTDIITHPKATETKSNKIPANFNVVLDPTVINGYIKKYLGFVWILFFIPFVFGAFAYRIVQGLIYAIIGKFFNLMVQTELTYNQILQIALVAITPAIILATVIDFFTIIIKHPMILYFILAMIYLFFGILANRPQKQVETPGT